MWNARTARPIAFRNATVRRELWVVLKRLYGNPTVFEEKPTCKCLRIGGELAELGSDGKVPHIDGFGEFLKYAQNSGTEINLLKKIKRLVSRLRILR